MFLFDLFRSFLPLHNPIGFGSADFIEFALAAMLVLMVALHGRVEPAAADRLAAGVVAAFPCANAERGRRFQLPAAG